MGLHLRGHSAPGVCAPRLRRYTYLRGADRRTKQPGRRVQGSPHKATVAGTEPCVSTARHTWTHHEISTHPTAAGPLASKVSQGLWYARLPASAARPAGHKCGRQLQGGPPLLDSMYLGLGQSVNSSSLTVPTQTALQIAIGTDHVRACIHTFAHQATVSLRSCLAAIPCGCAHGDPAHRD